MAAEGVHERVHVGGRDVVLLVPGRGRQHDVAVKPGVGHPEVDAGQQIKLPGRCLVARGRITRPIVVGYDNSHYCKYAVRRAVELARALASRFAWLWHEATSIRCRAGCR
jgi:hypothetical protein